MQIGHDGGNGLECCRPGNWGGGRDRSVEDLRWVIGREVVWGDTSGLAGKESCLCTSRTALALANLVVVFGGAQELVVVETFDSAGCDSHGGDTSRAGRSGTSISHLLEVGRDNRDGRSIVSRSVECADLGGEGDTNALGGVNDAGGHALGLRSARSSLRIIVDVGGESCREWLANVQVIDCGESSLVGTGVNLADWLLIVLLPSLLVIVLQKLEEF